MITDIRMPKGDGVGLLKGIKAINSNSPVICITGFSNIPSSSLLEQGALAVFEKPFDIQKLRKKVMEVLDLQ